MVTLTLPTASIGGVVDMAVVGCQSFPVPLVERHIHVPTLVSQDSGQCLISYTNQWTYAEPETMHLIVHLRLGWIMASWEWRLNAPLGVALAFSVVCL